MVMTNERGTVRDAPTIVGTAAVVGGSGLRTATRGDLVVPGHRTEWGSRSFAAAGPICWNKFPLDSEICRLVLRLLRDA